MSKIGYMFIGMAIQAFIAASFIMTGKASVKQQALAGVLFVIIALVSKNVGRKSSE
ncbi:hypothetical protein HOB10_01925 [Candidatus Parcubacteria bacterium]|jgi:hypothetical protein|nr:hypothetical protein [Candidatus Parcubacteria bacterium]